MGVAALAQNNSLSEDNNRIPREEDKYIGVPETIAAGKEIFVTMCSLCHGPNGEGGRGPNLIGGRNVRQATHKELFNSIKNGIGGDMPPLNLPDEKIWQITAFVRSLSSPAYLQQVPGDPEAGKIVFDRLDCLDCHMLRGQGGYLAPDLSSVGGIRNLNQIREGLLEPNTRFTEGFLPIRVTTRDGQKISGVAKNHSNYSFQIIDKEGNLFLFPSHELQEVEFLEKSWMPDDYKKLLSEEAIQNLLAFLSRQALRVPMLTDFEEDR